MNKAHFMDEETEAPSASEASPEARRAKQWGRWGWILIAWLTAQRTAAHVNRPVSLLCSPCNYCCSVAREQQRPV